MKIEIDKFSLGRLSAQIEQIPRALEVFRGNEFETKELFKAVQEVRGQLEEVLQTVVHASWKAVD